MNRLMLLILIALTVVLAACDSQETGTILVEEVWTRPTPQGAQNTAFYMSIDNETDEDDALVGIVSGFCQTVELHQSFVDDEGVMEMRPLEGGRIPLPADEEVELEPGGLHAMCMQIAEPLQEGDRVVLTLQFENAPDIRVTAEVREEEP
ncbi:MAG: copper chaperone PCu(A)C [bacterium]